MRPIIHLIIGPPMLRSSWNSQRSTLQILALLTHHLPCQLISFLKTSTCHPRLQPLPMPLSTQSSLLHYLHPVMLTHQATHLQAPPRLLHHTIYRTSSHPMQLHHHPMSSCPFQDLQTTFTSLPTLLDLPLPSPFPQPAIIQFSVSSSYTMTIHPAYSSSRVLLPPLPLKFPGGDLPYARATSSLWMTRLYTQLQT